MPSTRSLAAAAIAAAAFLAACVRAPGNDPRLVSEWMHTLLPLYAGLAAAEPGMKSLDGVLNGFPELPKPEPGRPYDGTLTAFAAQRVVLDSLLREAFPTTKAAIARLAYASQNLSGATDFVAFDNPANLLRAGSASDRALILNRPKQPGAVTLPAVNMAGIAEPYWGEIRPFALKRWDECPVAEPPPFSTEPGSAFHREALEVVGITRRLTPEQRTTALYWADNPGETGTPPGHWIAIASQMVSQRRLAAADAARLTMLTAVAQADAFIASWGYKYALSTIRPRTYVRSVIDSTWEPAIPTPPFPEYPSWHSTQSAAAATIITALIGDVAFDDSTSISIGHEVRRFQSFTAASDEAGISRVYGGIHFPFGNVGGRDLGLCIGARLMERYQAAGAR